MPRQRDYQEELNARWKAAESLYGISESEALDLLKPYKWDYKGLADWGEIGIINTYLKNPEEVEGILRITAQSTWGWDITWLIKRKGKAPMMFVVTSAHGEVRTTKVKEEDYTFLMEKLLENGLDKMQDDYGYSNYIIPTGIYPTLIDYYTPARSIQQSLVCCPPIDNDGKPSIENENEKRFWAINRTLKEFFSHYE